jgi:hypothetical protein
VNDHKATIPHVSDALSTVLSNLIPPRAYTLLFPLLPGLFFETSLLLANPACVYALLARTQPLIGPSHAASLALVLFLAFVIGHAFVFLVFFLQTLLGYLYRLRTFVWEELCAVAFPLLFKPPAPPPPGKPQRPVWWTRHRTLRRFHQHILAGHQRHFVGRPEVRGAMRLWSRLARELLKTRYGIDAYSLEHALDQEEWNVLYSALGLLTLQETRGSVFMIAIEATGWCGLAATRFASSLENRYYIGFSIFLIIVGLFHDWNVIRNLNNPLFLGVLRVRALLREYPNATEHSGFPSSSSTDPK